MQWCADGPEIFRTALLSELSGVESSVVFWQRLARREQRKWHIRFEKEEEDNDDDDNLPIYSRSSQTKPDHDNNKLKFAMRYATAPSSK